MERLQPTIFEEQLHLASTHLILARKDGRPKAELEAKEAEFNKALHDMVASMLPANYPIPEVPENVRRAMVDYFESKSEGREDQEEKRTECFAVFGSWLTNITAPLRG